MRFISRGQCLFIWNALQLYWCPWFNEILSVALRWTTVNSPPVPVLLCSRSAPVFRRSTVCHRTGWRQVHIHGALEQALDDQGPGAHAFCPNSRLRVLLYRQVACVREVCAALAPMLLTVRVLHLGFSPFL
jgi:hypothetical protein